MSKKLKILVQTDPLNPNDNCVQCGINGNFTTIMRGEIVIVSEEVYTLLEEGGYNPSVKDIIEEKAKAQAEEKEKAQAQAEEKAKKLAEAQAQAEEKAKKLAEAQAQAEEKAKKLAEEKAK